MIIDGNKIAAEIFAKLKKQTTPQKQLAAVLVGKDPASLSFLKQKEKAAKELGINFKLHLLSESLTQAALEKKVAQITADKKVGGVIVQIPLPKKYDRVRVLNQIGISKDIDVLNGEKTSIVAPAAATLREILERVKFNPRGKEAVVVGSGLLIGYPVATWLMSKTKKTTVLNKGGLSQASLQTADLVITGVGVPGIIKGAQLKNGVVVIDFGYAKKNGVLKGDVVFASAQKIAKHITPVPNGTGPIVVAKLFENFYQACENQ